eukprot:12602274-Alexandrium_andersonii.AAC.1
MTLATYFLVKGAPPASLAGASITRACASEHRDFVARGRALRRGRCDRGGASPSASPRRSTVHYRCNSVRGVGCQGPGVVFACRCALLRQTLCGARYGHVQRSGC